MPPPTITTRARADMRSSHRDTCGRPQLRRGQAGAFGERLELLPDHLGMNLGPIAGLGREAAVGAGEDVLPADDPGIADQTLGDQLRVLDDVTSVRDDAGYQRLSRRER